MLSRRARAYTQAAQSATSGLALRDPAGPRPTSNTKTAPQTFLMPKLPAADW